MRVIQILSMILVCVFAVTAPVSPDAWEQWQESGLHVNADLPDTRRNVLLLGTDASGGEADAILIASVGVENGDIRLASIRRDTIVSVPGRGERKWEDCAGIGGPEGMMRMLNEQLKLNITEYIAVDGAGFLGVVDTLGGADVDVTESEMQSVNASLESAAKSAGMDSTEWDAEEARLREFGENTHLTGLQALCFARPFPGEDETLRIQRQRALLTALVRGCVEGEYTMTDIMRFMTAVYPQVDTNLTMASAVMLAQAVVFGAPENVPFADMPFSGTYDESTRDGVTALWDVDYAANASALYHFLYED